MGVYFDVADHVFTNIKITHKQVPAPLGNKRKRAAFTTEVPVCNKILHSFGCILWIELQSNKSFCSVQSL